MAWISWSAFAEGCFEGCKAWRRSPRWFSYWILRCATGIFVWPLLQERGLVDCKCDSVAAVCARSSFFSSDLAGKSRGRAVGFGESRAQSHGPVSVEHAAYGLMSISSVACGSICSVASAMGSNTCSSFRIFVTGRLGWCCLMA